MKTINIKDIAKKAGVGVSTVSRVLNNQPDVKAATKERVLKIIEELNYVPNNSARNLKRIKTNHIGVFVIGDYSSFFSTIIETIEKDISKHGFSIVLHFHHSQKKLLESAVQFSLEKKLVGLICLGGEITKEEEGYINQFNIPVVFGSTMIDENIDDSKFSTVTINNKKASYSAVEYLLKLNHKKIALISAGKGYESVAKVRHDAYITAINDYNVEYDSNYVSWGDYSMQSGYDAMNQLFERNLDITSVFAVSDSMAIGAAKAIRDNNLRIPEDISIVGFDGLEITRFIHPALTTIEQPTDVMGKKIIDVMLRQLESEEPIEVEHIVLDTKLIEGQSCLKLTN